MENTKEEIAHREDLLLSCSTVTHCASVCSFTPMSVKQLAKSDGLLQWNSNLRLHLRLLVTYAHRFDSLNELISNSSFLDSFHHRRLLPEFTFRFLDKLHLLVPLQITTWHLRHDHKKRHFFGIKYKTCKCSLAKEISSCACCKVLPRQSWMAELKTPTHTQPLMPFK